MTPANDDPLRAIQHDVRRLRRCLRIHSVLLIAVLVLNFILPLAVVVAHQ